LSDVPSVEEAFRVLAPAPVLWCRIRTGTGSRGAIPVRTPQQALSWIRYWETMRGIPFEEFMLSEYLPGRDFTCETIWKDGSLIVVKTAERLSYFGGAERPSGTSSNAALAKTVFEPAVVSVSTAVVRALDPKATGVFSVDLKADANGAPSVTEINIGRVFSTTSLFDLVGKHNMAYLYVRLALGEPVDIVDDYDVVPDYYFVRHIDTVPDIIHADDVFEGIIDART
jgi:carbamoyl-phosphate synthase large subunit